MNFIANPIEFNQNISIHQGLTKKLKKVSFSQSFGEFYAESRKVKIHVINLLRNSEVNLRASA